MDAHARPDIRPRRCHRWRRWLGASVLAGWALLGLALGAAGWWRLCAASATPTDTFAWSLGPGVLWQFGLLAVLLGLWRPGLLARGRRRGLPASVAATLAARHRATLGLVLVGVEWALIGEWFWRGAP